MNVKKTPMRTCVVTKEKLEKKDLIRVVRMPDGEICVDLTGKKNGRGAYLKKDLEVLEKARKNKILDRILEIEVKDKVYDELNELLK